MLSLFVAPLILGTAHAMDRWHHSQVSASYTFEQYVKDFGKEYASEEEHLKRKAVFEASLQEALRHNGDASQLYKKAVNQFADRSASEFRNSHGWMPSWSTSQELESHAAPPVPSDFRLEDLPKSVDWRKKGVVTPIKNQGMCGSCWAFSSTESMESHIALNATSNHTLMVLSPQNLVSCDPNPNDCGGTGGCGGSVPELAFKYVADNGIATEKDYPYVSGHTSQDEPCKPIKPAAKIDGWVKLPKNNYTAVMYALANIGPLSVNVDAIPMQSYGGGVFTGCSEDKTHIDHVVQLVGYGHDSDLGQDYWIMRNSWGTTWGEAGYMRLARNPKQCAWDIYPSDGTGCKNGPGQLWVCGACGLLFDVSYPFGAQIL